MLFTPPSQARHYCAVGFFSAGASSFHFVFVTHRVLNYISLCLVRLVSVLQNLCCYIVHIIYLLNLDLCSLYVWFCSFLYVKIWNEKFRIMTIFLEVSYFSKVCHFLLNATRRYVIIFLLQRINHTFLLKRAKKQSKSFLYSTFCILPYAILPLHSAHCIV